LANAERQHRRGGAHLRDTRIKKGLPIRISHFELRVLELPYREPVRWRSVAEASGQYLLLRICTDDGVYGLAEVTDKPAWTGATPLMTAQALRDKYEPLLNGMDPLAPERIWAALDQIPTWNSAKSAIDIALTDLAARCAGLPLWKYLGGWTDDVPVAWLVTLASPEEQLRDAVHAVEAHGFQALKVKIGRDPNQDMDSLQRLRKQFGDTMHIAVDANSQYSLEQAAEVAAELHDRGVVLFEDPCSFPTEQAATRFFENSPVAVMIDQEAGTPRDAARYMRLGAHAIALKIGRTGYRLSETIRQHCQLAEVGCGVGVSAESGLGSLISLHFRGAHQNLDSIPAENSFFLKLETDVLRERLSVIDGRVKLACAPGLGIDLDQRVLERYSTLV
jgi:L-alanine-DL-glutamate epimerase-like enolase superfamily enzyme